MPEKSLEFFVPPLNSLEIIKSGSFEHGGRGHPDKAFGNLLINNQLMSQKRADLRKKLSFSPGF